MGCIIHENIQYIKWRFAPLLLVVVSWNHRRLSRRLKPPSCRPQPYLLLHLAKQYSNALAVRRRQEPMSLICLPWYKMKSCTAIAPLKSTADQKYPADPTATMWYTKANKYQQNLIIKCRPTCNHSGRQWITSDKWGHHLKGNVSELPVPSTSKCVSLLSTRVKVVVWNHRRFSGRLKPPSCRPPPYLLLHLANNIQTHPPFAAIKGQSPYHFDDELQRNAALCPCR